MSAILEPEVAGGLGEGTVMDRSVHPPRVSRLVYEFEGWLGDDIVESFPCFLVTEALAQALTEAGLTGFALADVTVQTTDEFTQHSARPLPEFRWLQITGAAHLDDFWLHTDYRLAVSTRALDVLGTHRLDNAVVEPLPN
jgi:hypothetical protein